MNYKLRNYQQEAVDKGTEFFASSKKDGAIIVAPTASGKSLIVASIAKNLNGKTLILQPNKEILEQNYQKMVSFGITDAKIFSASCGIKEVGRITLATIGSIINRKELFAEFSNLIIDECHSVNAKGGMYEELIGYIGGKVLGLTATPYRLHNYNDMKTMQRALVAKFLHRTRPRLFQEVIQVTQVSDLYEQGFLAPVEYKVNSGYNHNQIGLNSTGMDFDQDSLKAYNEKIGVMKLLKATAIGAPEKHKLVFTSSVEEAENLAEALNENKISSAIVSAKTPKKERERILDEFKKGEIKVVTNCGTLTTGFDFPELDCVILGRPVQSVSLYYQMMGRGLRIAPNKEKVTVYDLCGNVPRFGKIETFEIIEPKKNLHRLKSNMGYLTGFDFIGKKDLEEKGYKGLQEGAYSGGKVLRFGKHKGTHITKIPNSYLKWVLNNFDKGSTKKMFEEEAKRRGIR